MNRKEEERNLSRLIHRALNKVRFLKLDKFDSVAEAFENAIQLMEQNRVDGQQGGGDLTTRSEEEEDEEEARGHKIIDNHGPSSNRATMTSNWLKNISMHDPSTYNKGNEENERNPKRASYGRRDFHQKISMEPKVDATIDTSSPALSRRRLGDGAPEKNKLSSRAKDSTQYTFRGDMRTHGKHKSLSNTQESTIQEHPSPSLSISSGASPRMSGRRMTESPKRASSRASASNSASFKAAESTSSDEGNQMSVTEVDDVDDGNGRLKLLTDSPRQKSSRNLLMNLATRHDVSENNDFVSSRADQNRFMNRAMPSENSSAMSKVDAELLALTPKRKFTKRLDSPGMRGHELQQKRSKLNKRLEHARDLVPMMQLEAFPKVKAAFMDALALLEQNTFDVVTTEQTF